MVHPTIGIFNYDAIPTNIETFIIDLTETIERSSMDFSMLVLPSELQLFDHEKFDHKIMQSFLKDLKKTARQNMVWMVSGPFLCNGSGNITLRTFLVNDAGMIKGYYDNCHGNYESQVRDIKCGCKPLIFDHYGLTCALSDTTDLSYPEFFRAMALNGVEAIIVSSSFSSVQKQNMEILLKARAIENQMYIIFSGAACSQENRDLRSGPFVIDPKGSTITEEMLTKTIKQVEIDNLYVQKLRKDTGILANRNPELYYPTICQLKQKQKGAR